MFDTILKETASDLVYLSQMKQMNSPFVFIRLALFYFCLIFPVGLSAIALNFKNYVVEDGISNNIITCCHQDAQGYMWFGTRDGLNRFDGYSFRVFRFDDLLPNTFGESNAIRCITTDSEGTLWVGTAIGVLKYDAQTETFSLIPGSSGMNAKELTFSPQGDLWMILDGKLVNYHIKLESFQTYNLPDNGRVASFCQAPSGDIWAVLTNGMLYCFNPYTGQCTGYNLFSQDRGVPNKTLTKVVLLPSGNKLLVGSVSSGAKMFDIQTGRYTNIFTTTSDGTGIAVRDFLLINPYTAWIATEHGLYIYDLDSGKYTVEQHKPYDPYTLSTNFLFTLFKDKEGGVWIGTYAGGVNYLSPFQGFEKYYAYRSSDGNGMHGDVVHNICTDSHDRLWIATEDAGLNRWDPVTSHFNHYTFPEFNLHGLATEGDTIWVATLSNVYQMNIHSGAVTKSWNFSDKGQLVCLKRLANGTLMAGTTAGAYRLNRHSDSFEFMNQFPSGNRVQCIFEGNDGTIYAGTVNNGVHYFNPKDGSYGKFRHDTLSGANSNTINDIYQDHNEDLWFATMYGIRKVEHATGKIKRYTTENGMPGNISFQILPDDESFLWISTTSGLVCLNPQTDEISTYSIEHGIITNQFNYNSSHKDRFGRLYFGMIRGMISFYPQEVKSFHHYTKPHLTSITVFSKDLATPQQTLPVPASRHIVLKSNQSTFNIDFSTLSYIAPNSTAFAYTMEGLDNNKWTILHGSHTAYYTQIPHGAYTFKVISTNSLNRWNKDAETISITILRPWWLSKVAQSIYGLVILCMISLFIWLIIRKNKRRMIQSVRQLQYDKEKELYQAKINFFVDVAHEIRTPLTLIKSPLEKAMQDRGLSDESQRYLSVVEKNADNMLSLVNQLLDFRKTELDNYRLSFVKTDMVSFLQDCCSRFKDTADQRKLQLNFSSPFPSYFAFVDKEACRKIINNLLSNALKFSSSRIDVSLYSKEPDISFIVDVSNDGRPIDASISEKIFEPFYRGEMNENKSGSGLGLPLARSMAEMHRGTLTLVNIQSNLTTFRLHLPTSQPDSILLQNKKTESVTYDMLPVADNEANRATVLLVEDNEEMLEFIYTEARKVYNILCATNGKEALDCLEKNVVHLIVSDIMMPVMDGIALLKNVKTHQEYNHIPVILLTAKTTIQSRIEGLELGADAYMEKPFSMDALLAQIANLLQSREKMREFYFHSPLAHMKTMACNKADEEFLDTLYQYICENLADRQMDVDGLAAQMNMSRPTLYRKINGISNLTPNELIRMCRLKKATEYIVEGKLSLSEVAEQVGFSSLSYFSRSFTRQFHTSPSEYAREIKSNTHSNS